MAVAFGTVLVTWLVWRQTWFGVRLTDDELVAVMAADAKPRDVQHAIEEVTRRYDENAANWDRWAQLLLSASRRAEDPVRNTAAWGMGRTDARRPEFSARLAELVASDPSLLVRRNAALALAAGGDARGRPVLRSMLEPFVVTAPEDGVVASLAAIDAVLRENAPAGRLTTASGSETEVRTPVPGSVLERRAAEGERVEKGAPLVVLAPDPDHALGAVRALGAVGTTEDLDLLGVLAGPHAVAREDVKALARAAVEAIRARAK